MQIQTDLGSNLVVPLGTLPLGTHVTLDKSLHLAGPRLFSRANVALWRLL